MSSFLLKITLYALNHVQKLNLQNFHENNRSTMRKNLISGASNEKLHKTVYWVSKTNVALCYFLESLILTTDLPEATLSYKIKIQFSILS
jgi:hypothetical protein